MWHKATPKLRYHYLNSSLLHFSLKNKPKTHQEKQEYNIKGVGIPIGIAEAPIGSTYFWWMHGWHLAWRLWSDSVRYVRYCPVKICMATIGSSVSLWEAESACTTYTNSGISTGITLPTRYGKSDRRARSAAGFWRLKIKDADDVLYKTQ